MRLLKKARVRDYTGLARIQEEQLQQGSGLPVVQVGAALLDIQCNRFVSMYSKRLTRRTSGTTSR